MDKAKGKDPGFLFYTRDFYEGTRMMTPEERACYIDLLIYQHQNGGFIPNDPKRLAMYCSGISEATLKATLQAKFKLCDKGWFNERLAIVIEERAEFTEKQSVNGTVGQFFKKAKAILNKRDFQKLQSIYNPFPKRELFDLINNKSIDEAMLQAMLKAELKHLADANANANANADANANANADVLGKEGMGEKPFLEDQGTTFGIPTTFEKSKWFNKTVFFMECPEDWPTAKREHYYQAALAWSQDNPKKKKIDWIRAVKVWDGNRPWSGSKGYQAPARPMTENQRLNEIARSGGHLKVDENNRVRVVGSIIQGPMQLDSDGNMVLYCGPETLRIFPSDGYKSNKLYEPMYGRTIEQIHQYLKEKETQKLKTA